MDFKETSSFKASPRLCIPGSAIIEPLKGNQKASFSSTICPNQIQGESSAAKWGVLSFDWGLGGLNHCSYSRVKNLLNRLYQGKSSQRLFIELNFLNLWLNFCTPVSVIWLQLSEDKLFHHSSSVYLLKPRVIFCKESRFPRPSARWSIPLPVILLHLWTSSKISLK